MNGMSDQVKERVKLETELLRYLFIAGIASGSGTLSVLLGGLAGLRLSVVILGVLATISIGIFSWFQYNKIQSMIQEGGTV